MKKIDYISIPIIAVLITFAIVISVSACEKKQEVSAVEITVEDVEEDTEIAYESELIQVALMNSIGRIEEDACFGYSFSKLVGIIYHESGGDYELSRKIATCVVNAQRKYDNKYTPIEICEMYHYTDDMGYFGSKTLAACIDVFINGEIDEEVGNATMFYNKNICGYNETHESQCYVCSYEHERYGEIRFFEEVE